MPSRIDIGPEGGPFVAINENSNDLELQDINGNVIAVWDETEGQWDLNNNSLTNINAIDASSATLDSSTVGSLEAGTQVYEEESVILQNNEITVNNSLVKVTSEDGTNLKTINGEVSGKRVILFTNVNFVIENASGNILLDGAADVEMRSTRALEFIYDGLNWVELGRRFN